MQELCRPEVDSDASQRLASLSVADVANSRLRQVLERHSRVFTEVLPVKTAEQIAQSNKFSIVLIGEAVRPVKQRERRVSPAEIEAATQWVKEEVAAGRMEPSSSEWAAQLVIVPKRNENGEVTGWRICGDYRKPQRSDEAGRRAAAADADGVRPAGRHAVLQQARPAEGLQPDPCRAEQPRADGRSVRRSGCTSRR